jgi:hypothetical protein
VGDNSGVISPARIFASMVPGAASMMGCVGSVAGSNLPASCEAAAWCSGMDAKDRRWWPAARWKFCMDAEAALVLKSMVHLQAAKWATSERWFVPKGSFYLSVMAELAVAEVHCKSRDDGSLQRIGDGCVAKSMGLSVRHYRRTWKRRYLRVAQLPDQWAGGAASYVVARQRQG